MAVRVNQDVVEVIVKHTGHARTDQVVAEVLVKHPGHTRVDQVVLEVIVAKGKAPNVMPTEVEWIDRFV